MTDDQPNTVLGLVHASALFSAGSMALLAPDRPALTYRELLDQIRGFGTELRSRGVSRKDPVAIVLPNGPEMASAFLAVASYATAAPLNPALTEREFEFYLADLGAKILVTEPAAGNRAAAAAHRMGITVLEIRNDPERSAGTLLEGPIQEDVAEPDAGQPDDTALLLHTSGTTARPKLTPLSHRNLAACVRAIHSTLGLSTSDRCLNVMPLFHVHGLVGAMLCTLSSGGSVVCTGGLDVSRMFEWLERYRPTWYTAAPTMHRAVLERATDEPHRARHTSLRFIRSAAAALPASVATRMEAMFGVPVIEAYGMTEASQQICSNPLPPAVRKLGSVGLAAGPQVRVVDDEGRSVPSGTPGNVVIRGASVTKGYLRPEGVNSMSFVNGWFQTGDLGYFDEDGYLFLRGRRTETINRGGELISPHEIDEVLREHPAIQQVAVFGVPHEGLGEMLVAAVVVRPGWVLSVDDIRRFSVERLASFKIPSRWLFVDNLPAGPTGKIQRKLLKDQVGLDDSERIGSYLPVPATDSERKIAEIWSSVLRLKQIGVSTDLHSLGADSLQMGQIVARINEVFGTALTLKHAFDFATIRDQSRLVDDIRNPVDEP